MTQEQLKELFLEYWRDSYPSAPPGVHAINSHVGFGIYVLERQDAYAAVNGEEQ